MNTGFSSSETASTSPNFFAPTSQTPPSFAGRIGVARADITPPVGINNRNWGAATRQVCEGIHRPLTATALTFATDENAIPLVFIALDLGWWRDREDEGTVRNGLLEALGLPSSQLIMNLSHTHAGPCISLQNEAQPGGHLIRPFLHFVRETCIELVQNALQHARESTLSFTQDGCCLARNRDVRDPFAPHRFVVGYDAQTPCDQTLLVGRVSDSRGETRATVVNYACHPTTLAWQNALISPDYIGAMREVVETQTGAPCLFLQGASGELAPRQQFGGDLEIADRLGRQLGFSCLSALQALPPHDTRLELREIVESGAPLALWHETPFAPNRALAATESRVELPLQTDLPSLESLETEVARLQGAPELGDNRAQIERLRRKMGVRRIVGEGQSWPMPIWGWRLGDILWFGQPNEAYSPLQTELRARFADAAVVVMNLCNGSCGYLPPAPLYDEEIYAVWQSPFARGGLEKLIGAAEELLRETAKFPPETTIST
jgi:hypothetical protein